MNITYSYSLRTLIYSPHYEVKYSYCSETKAANISFSRFDSPFQDFDSYMDVELKQVEKIADNLLHAILSHQKLRIDADDMIRFYRTVPDTAYVGFPREVIQSIFSRNIIRIEISDTTEYTDIQSHTLELKKVNNDWRMALSIEDSDGEILDEIVIAQIKGYSYDDDAFVLCSMLEPYVRKMALKHRIEMEYLTIKTHLKSEAERFVDACKGIMPMDTVFFI